MAIKIQAAARLCVVAKASEAQARKYLESLHIGVGDVYSNRTGTISFEVAGNLAGAKATLTRKFGKPTPWGPKHFAWDLGSGRKIRISQVSTGSGSSVIIDLLDASDR